MQGELILNAGGFPVAWYPLREDGTSKADDHPIGEGLDEVRTIRRDGQDIDFQPFSRVPMGEEESATWWVYDADGSKIPSKRLRPDILKEKKKAHKHKNPKKCKNLLDRSVLTITDIVKPTDYKDLTGWVKALDTFRNTLYTIGAAGDYAGYNAMITGGTMSSGDTGQEIDGGDYNENVGDGGLDGIQLIAGATRPRIWANAGTVVSIGGNEGWFIDFMEVDGNSQANDGLAIGSIAGMASRVISHDVVDSAIGTSNDGSIVVNSIAYNADRGIYNGSTTHGKIYHSLCVDVTSLGFWGAGANDLRCSACIAFNCGTPYSNIFTATSSRNVADSGVGGNGGQNGFLSSHFENYAADDFRISPSGAAWLAARFKGWPLVADDAEGNTRKKSISAPVFYPGPYDPDPIFSPDNYALPAAENQVLVGNDYGLVTGLENSGSFDEAARNSDPGVGNVLDGVNYEIQNVPKSGTFDEAARNVDPGVGNVLSLVDYLIQNVPKTGTFDETARNTDPGVANVKLDTPYLIYNVAKVGTYNPGGSPPNVVVLTAVDKEDGTGVTFTIANSTDLASNQVSVVDGDGVVTEVGDPVIGNGSFDYALPIATYLGYAISTLGGNCSISLPVPVVSSDTSLGYTRSDFGEDFADIQSEFDEFTEEVTYRRGLSVITVQMAKEMPITVYDDDQGIDIAVGDCAWRIDVTRLDFGAGIVEPRKGDEILTAQGDRFIVIEPGEIDDEQIERKIPCRRREHKQ